MLSRLDHRRKLVYFSLIAFMGALGGALCIADSIPLIKAETSEMLVLIGRYILCLDAVILLVSIFTWLCIHGVFKGGLKYVFMHSKMISNLQMELHDAGIYVKRYFFTEEVALLPKIKVTFADNYLTGEVRIEKTIKDRLKLEDKDISCALGNYIVEQTFTSSDGNWNLYDIYDASFDRQLTFKNCEDFRNACTSTNEYELMIDAVTTIPLHHSLICGQTGSGKSYACNTLIFQMLSKNVAYNLYFADPKQSGMAVIGKSIDVNKTADTIDGIIALIGNFHSELEKRKETMESLLTDNENIDADYRSFNLQPYVMIFDEYLAFSLALANCKKETRDEIAHMLSDIVLMGRQCGFFLWLIMQSAPSTQIPTFIRDQLVFKVVLGNSDKSTYTVTFEAGADIPSGKFSIGYGVYSFSGLTDKPKILAFPSISNFDLIQAIR